MGIMGNTPIFVSVIIILIIAIYTHFLLIILFVQLCNGLECGHRYQPKIGYQYTNPRIHYMRR